MYEELKRLQQKYPIGTEVNVVEQIRERKLPYYCERDLIEYRRKYGKVEVLDDVYCLVKEKIKVADTVDGYLFDGNNWIIVENTWDGWLPIDVEENDGSE